MSTSATTSVSSGAGTGAGVGGVVPPPPSSPTRPTGAGPTGGPPLTPSSPGPGGANGPQGGAPGQSRRGRFFFISDHGGALAKAGLALVALGAAAVYTPLGVFVGPPLLVGLGAVTALCATAYVGAKLFKALFTLAHQIPYTCRLRTTKDTACRIVRGESFQQASGASIDGQRDWVTNVSRKSMAKHGISESLQKLETIMAGIRTKAQGTNQPPAFSMVVVEQDALNAFEQLLRDPKDGIEDPKRGRGISAGGAADAVAVRSKVDALSGYLEEKYLKTKVP